MNAHTATFTIGTRGKGTCEITEEVARVVRESGVMTGTATVFIRHTSASLIIYENADHSARTDLHEFFERLVPEDTDYFVHTAEGADDMPSHLQMRLGDCRREKHPLLHWTTAASSHTRDSATGRTDEARGTRVTRRPRTR